MDDLSGPKSRNPRELPIHLTGFLSEDRMKNRPLPQPRPTAADQAYHYKPSQLGGQNASNYNSLPASPPGQTNAQYHGHRPELSSRLIFSRLSSSNVLFSSSSRHSYLQYASTGVWRSSSSHKIHRPHWVVQTPNTACHYIKAIFSSNHMVEITTRVLSLLRALVSHRFSHLTNHIEQNVPISET
jgi:hypothetical protein